MTEWLAFLLVFTIAGLGVLGYLAFKLHVKTMRMEADLGAQEARHAQEINPTTSGL